MATPRTLTLVLAAASIAALCADVRAQSPPVQDLSAAHYKVREVPAAVPAKPFPSGSETPGRVPSIEIRSADQMTKKDRELEADAESSIGERAAFMGFDFNQGKWSYQQLLCPALPNHIFLRFMRDSGVGDVSLFTAAIPRGGDGRVRIIPIRMRGYSLFSPAPINALTISAFNHIRAEEDPDKAPDWLGTGLCYAALAGGQARAPNLTLDLESEKYPAAIQATEQIPVRGGAVIEFTDAALTPRLMQWTMIFDAKGRLLKATHVPLGLLKVNLLPATATAINGAPLPSTVGDIDMTGRAVQ